MDVSTSYLHSPWVVPSHTLRSGTAPDLRNRGGGAMERVMKEGVTMEGVMCDEGVMEEGLMKGGDGEGYGHSGRQG